MNVAIDVILPVCNVEKQIRSCLQSIDRGSSSNWRLLIIDYGSTDNTIEIIEDFPDDRISIIQLGKMASYADALNAGVTATTAKYIALMNAQYEMLPGRLAHQMAILENNPNVGVLGGGVATIDKNVDASTASRNQLVGPHIGIKTTMLFENPLVDSAVMLRRDVLSNDAFSVNFTGIECFELWSRLIENFVFANDATPVICEGRGTKSDSNELQHTPQWADLMVNLYSKLFYRWEIGASAHRWVEYLITGNRTLPARSVFQKLLDDYQRIGIHPQLLYARFHTR